MGMSIDDNMSQEMIDNNDCHLCGGFMMVTDPAKPEGDETYTVYSCTTCENEKQILNTAGPTK